MKKILLLIVMTLFFVAAKLHAQTEPAAGNWKTWFISSGKDYRLPAPASYKNEIAEIISKQKNLNPTELQQILYWNTTAPGHHWQTMMMNMWTVDTGRYVALAKDRK